MPEHPLAPPERRREMSCDRFGPGPIVFPTRQRAFGLPILPVPSHAPSSEGHFPPRGPSVSKKAVPGFSKVDVLREILAASHVLEGVEARSGVRGTVGYAGVLERAVIQQHQRSHIVQCGVTGEGSGASAEGNTPTN